MVDSHLVNQVNRNACAIRNLRNGRGDLNVNSLRVQELNVGIGTTTLTDGRITKADGSLILDTDEVGFTRLVDQSNGIWIGANTGEDSSGADVIAIGTNAGRVGQGTGAVAIGPNMGTLNQGSHSVMIGCNVSTVGPNAIVLNANPTNPPVLDVDNSNGLFIQPIGTVETLDQYCLTHNIFTGEIRRNTAKAFVIDHPVKQENYLVHACLEGPEAGVYYRGEGRIPDGSDNILIRLPEYVPAFARDYTVTVAPIGRPRQLGVSRVEGGAFTVYGDPGEFFWHVFGKREDIVTEPAKEGHQVCGQGPYRWVV